MHDRRRIVLDRDLRVTPTRNLRIAGLHVIAVSADYTMDSQTGRTEPVVELGLSFVHLVFLCGFVSVSGSGSLLC